MSDSTSPSPKTKVCPKCKKEKPINEFGIAKHQPGGRRYRCKVCHREDVRAYQKTPAGKATQERTRIKNLHKPSRVKKRRAYYKSKTYKCHRREYRQTEQHKELKRKASARYRAKNKTKIAARDAVSKAINSGTLAHPSTLSCSCGAMAQEYHHSSYAKDKWLDVIAVCVECHNSIHTKPLKHYEQQWEASL